MKKALSRCLLILLIVCSKSIVSQVDTVFWFAAPWVTPGHAGNTPVKMRLSSFNNPTQVRVRQPAGTFDTTFTIPANSLISESLSHLINQIENVPSNVIYNRGLKITSDFPITVVYEVETVVNNPETYSLKGQNGMGKEFVCPFQTRSNNGPYTPAPKSQISIVATDNNTTVWITPKCNVVGHAANVTYSITLNVGQSYNVENVSGTPSAAGQNLSGTIVVSDKPISVTVTDDSVRGVSGCYDLMGDQIVSVDIVGTQYVINKGGLSAGENEGGYVVATQNFTQITINDGVTATYSVLLNKGDTYYVPISQPLTYITADQPVYVIHASGFGCEMGEAILPPLNCAGSSQVSFTRTNTQTFILNILCKTTAIGSFTLNGSATLVPASGFTVVPGTGGTLSGFQRSYTTVEIPAGTANLLTNSMDVFSLGVINGGASSGCLYHYMSSFLRKTFTVADADKNICTATTTVSLNGNITGGSTTGIWTTPNGTGTFGNANSLVTTYSLSTNDLNQSQIKLILSSTGNCTPVSDTVLVNIFKSPIVNASNGVTLCKNNISSVPLSGTLQFAAGTNWTTSGSGSFGNPGSLNTTYLPSPADLIADSVKIKLTSTGSLNGCPNTYDSLVIKFINPPVVNTSGDVSVCANNPTVAITGTVGVLFTTGVWSTTGSGLFTPTTTSLNTVYQLSPADITQGNIIIRLTSTNNLNCKQVYDSLKITVTPKPNVNAGLNDTICSSNLFYPVNGTITGGASAGTWTSLGNGTFGNANNLSTIYTLGQNDTLAGQVKLILTSTGSNCLPEKDTVVVIIAKSPLVNAGNDNAVCDNQLIPLNGTVFGLTTTGAWTALGTGIFIPDDSLLTTYYQPSPLDISAGSVRLVLTSTYNKGCAAIHDTIKITFKPAPYADYNANNQCAKKLANFTDNSTTGSGSITGWSWNFGDNATSIAQNATHAYANPGTYTVTHVAFSSNGCRDTIQKPIEIYFLPQALFYQNTPCVGNATQFVDSSKTQSGSLIGWNWNFGDNTSSGIQNPTHAYSSASNYTVALTVTSSFGCKDTVIKQITVIPGPSANFTINPDPLEALETGNFTDLSTGPSSLINWYWGFGDESASNQQNPTHSYNVPGDYSVYLAVKDINGCIDTVRKEITVVLLPDVPTAFSPNADGQNDYFLVRGGPFKTIDVRIYNNWGQLIFETNNQSDGWNGTFNGTEQPIGVYVWVVEVEMLNGKKIKKTGDVTLLR